MRGASSYNLPILISVLLHGALVAAVAWGWKAASHENQVVVPRYIEAKMVELKATTPKAAKPKQTKKIDLAAQRAEQARKKREADAKRKAALAKKQQAEKEKKEREAQERKARELAEKERKAKELAMAEQLRMEDELNDLLEEEDALMRAQQAEATAQSYMALITERIRQNWSRPPSARNGMKTRLQIQLVPTGRIVDVSITDGSGNAAFDRSAEQAVWKVEQFTELQGMDSAVFEQYFRKVSVLFEPQDLRL
ncbi:cell envelope integrity protein TolA [Aurantivibrio plasticivorans]